MSGWDYNEAGTPARWILATALASLGLLATLTGWLSTDHANDRAERYEQNLRELDLCAAVAQDAAGWKDCRDEVLR